MKKISLSVLMTIVGFTSFAQLQNAGFLLGGSAAFHAEPISAGTNYTTYSIQPVAGYVLAEDKLLGVAFSYSGINVKYDPDFESNNRTIEAGFFYRKYNSITEKIFFNWQLTAGISSSRGENDLNETSTFGIGARVSPGLTWAATEKLLVVSRVGNLSYFQQTGDLDGAAIDVSFNSLSLGLEFLLK